MVFVTMTDSVIVHYHGMLLYIHIPCSATNPSTRPIKKFPNPLLKLPKPRSQASLPAFRRWKGSLGTRLPKHVHTTLLQFAGNAFPWLDGYSTVGLRSYVQCI